MMAFEPLKNESEKTPFCSEINVFIWHSSAKIYSHWLAISTSGTRFGKVLPHRQKIKTLWQFFEGLFCIWQKFESTLAILNAVEKIFIILNGPLLKNNLAIWSRWFRPSFDKAATETKTIHACHCQHSILSNRNKIQFIYSSTR